MSETRNGIALRPPQLARTRRIAVYTIGGGVWLSGAIWVLLHYFFMVEGEFGLSPHSLEFWFLVTHGAFAFFSLWLLGLLWGVHVTPGWRSLRRRWTGGLMFGLFAWLALTGYLLYYVGNEDIREASNLIHWTTGLASPIPFLLHRFARDPLRRKL